MQFAADDDVAAGNCQSITAARSVQCSHVFVFVLWLQMLVKITFCISLFVRATWQSK